MNADREFDDPALAALLDEASHDTPSPAVDAAIRAAAHRAVSDGARDHSGASARSWRWWMPMAAAAVIGGVVIGVAPFAPNIPEVPSVVSDSPDAKSPVTPARDARRSEADMRQPSLESGTGAQGGAPSTEGSAHSVERRLPTTLRQERASEARRKVEREASAPPAEVSKRAGAPSPSAPEQFVPPPSESSRSGNGAQQNGALAPRAPGEASHDGAFVPRAPAANRAAKAEGKQDVGETPSRSSDEWIARIRALRAQGQLPEARGELDRFRGAYPDADARLPDDLRAWAAAIPR